MVIDCPVHPVTLTRPVTPLRPLHLCARYTCAARHVSHSGKRIMSIRYLAWLVSGVLVGGFWADASADTVELSGGGHVSGKVLRRVPTGKLPYIAIQVDDGMTIALPESRIDRVVTSDQLEEYRQLAQQAGNDAQKHYELAQWCVSNKSLPLEGQKRYHYQRAIAIDPEHELARAALGYVRDEKRQWILYSQQQRKRGMIRDAGKWKLPEAVAIEDFQDEINEKAKRWNKDIALLRSRAMNDKGKPEEAIQQLTAIDDPLAAQAIAKEFNSGQPRSLRIIYVNLLAKLRNAPSVYALTLAGLNDKDDVIREAALTELRKFGGASAVDYYRQKLKSNNKRDVRDALRALEFFPNPELAMTYIDALITEHKTESGGGSGINAGFGGPTSGGGGAGSFSTGSKKVIIVEPMKNAAALSLLKTIEPGADYGYDKQAWREHFARKLTTYAGDLRRDP